MMVNKYKLTVMKRGGNIAEILIWGIHHIARIGALAVFWAKPAAL